MAVGHWLSSQYIIINVDSSFQFSILIKHHLINFLLTIGSTKKSLLVCLGKDWLKILLEDSKHLQEFAFFLKFGHNLCGIFAQLSLKIRQKNTESKIMQNTKTLSQLWTDFIMR